MRTFDYFSVLRIVNKTKAFMLLLLNALSLSSYASRSQRMDTLSVIRPISEVLAANNAGVGSSSLSISSTSSGINHRGASSNGGVLTYTFTIPSAPLSPSATTNNPAAQINGASSPESTPTATAANPSKDLSATSVSSTIVPLNSLSNSFSAPLSSTSNLETSTSVASNTNQLSSAFSLTNPNPINLGLGTLSLAGSDSFFNTPGIANNTSSQADLSIYLNAESAQTSIKLAMNNPYEIYNPYDGADMSTVTASNDYNKFLQTNLLRNDVLFESNTASYLLNEDTSINSRTASISNLGDLVSSDNSTPPVTISMDNTSSTAAANNTANAGNNSGELTKSTPFSSPISSNSSVSTTTTHSNDEVCKIPIGLANQCVDDFNKYDFTSTKKFVDPSNPNMKPEDVDKISCNALQIVLLKNPSCSSQVRTILDKRFSAVNCNDSNLSAELKSGLCNTSKRTSLSSLVPATPTLVDETPKTPSVATAASSTSHTSTPKTNARSISTTTTTPSSGSGGLATSTNSTSSPTNPSPTQVGI